jgi:hypothetical protein
MISVVIYAIAQLRSRSVCKYLPKARESIVLIVIMLMRVLGGALLREKAPLMSLLTPFSETHFHGHISIMIPQMHQKIELSTKV